MSVRPMTRLSLSGRYFCLSALRFLSSENKKIKKAQPRLNQNMSVKPGFAENSTAITALEGEL